MEVKEAVDEEENCRGGGGEGGSGGDGGGGEDRDGRDDGEEGVGISDMCFRI